MGDSISAAYGIQRDDGWVALLDARLSETASPWKVVNASISGETTHGGVERLPGLLQSHDPTHLVIELGGNDGLRGLDFDQTRANFARMIEDGLEHPAHVMLIGVRMPPNFGAAYNQAFQSVFEALDRRYAISYLPRFLEGVAASDPALMQDDGIHPTEEAQAKLLENVWPVLEPILQ